MGKKSKTHKMENPVFRKSCIVHKWGYHNVDGMMMRFRVCERCGALEAKPIVPRSGLKWVSYAPSGGLGFIEALRSKIAKRSLAEQNGISLETKEVVAENIPKDAASDVESNK